MVQLALDVLESQEVATASHESNTPRMETPKRAGAVLGGESGGESINLVRRPKSMKVLNIGMSSLRGGHGVACSRCAAMQSMASAGGRRLRVLASTLDLVFSMVTYSRLDCPPMCLAVDGARTRRCEGEMEEQETAALPLWHL